MGYFSEQLIKDGRVRPYKITLSIVGEKRTFPFATFNMPSYSTNAEIMKRAGEIVEKHTNLINGRKVGIEVTDLNEPNECEPNDEGFFE
jgi:hypothetical protein